MKIAVIGAGAAGLTAAYFAALGGNDVTIYEKNEKSGKKIYITGKGRCNITNDVEPDEFLQNVVHNAKFVTGAVYGFPPREVMAYIENGGLKLKRERGGRIFPVSDKASDVTRCLDNYCRRSGVSIKYGCEVQNIEVDGGILRGIVVDKVLIPCDSVVICTGGKSYPSTGSTGDGYRFATSTGHSVIAPVPSLCGFNIKGTYCGAMQGLSLKNVSLSVCCGDGSSRSFFGEMLFTHYGVSGPIILSASAVTARLAPENIKPILDLKPALGEERLEKRMLSDFAAYNNKSIFNCLKELLPVAMIGEILSRSGISPEKKVNSVTREERRRLIGNIKGFVMQVMSRRGFEEAIVTSGGVNAKEINPKTMESKIVKGLYFCGEVLDIDAFTGGYNLQLAFSTGRAAGAALSGLAVKNQKYGVDG